MAFYRVNFVPKGYSQVIFDLGVGFETENLNLNVVFPDDDIFVFMPRAAGSVVSVCISDLNKHVCKALSPLNGCLDDQIVFLFLYLSNF